MDFINVRLIDCDTLIRESVVRNSDDSYTIFINARLSHERQIEAYNHAMIHIANNDFDNENVNEVELRAHGLI